MFHIERDIQDFVVVTRVFGEIDLTAIDQLRAAFDSALALTTAPHPVVVDLDGVTFLCSAGLSELYSASQRARDLGSGLRIVATRREVLRPLRVTGLADDLDLRASLADATGNSTAPELSL